MTGKTRIKSTTLFFVFLFLSTSYHFPTTVYGGNENNGDRGKLEAPPSLTFLSNEILPFASMKDGRPVGFAVEIIQEIMDRLGRSDVIEFRRWDVAYNRVLSEPNTVLLPPSRTPERENFFKWVGPLIPEKLVLFARKDSGIIINSLEDAKKVDGIASVTGYASEKLLQEKGFTNLVSHRSPTQCPDALKFGRVELWLNSNITMKQAALDANVDPDLFEPVYVIKEVPSYLAFSHTTSDELVNQWQSALDTMKRDGSWERIIYNWIPKHLLQIGQKSLGLSDKERVWLENHRSIRVVRFFHEPPFTIDDGDIYTGYLYELLFETLKQIGLQPEFIDEFTTYNSMVDALQKGDVDILTTMNSTRKLPGNISRTIPVVKTPYVVVGQINTPDIKNTADLFSKKVAVVKGYAQDQHLNKFPAIIKVHVSNNNEGFEAVRLGKAEYFLNNLANADYVLKKTFATDLRIAGTLSYVDFPPLTLSFGIHGKDIVFPGIFHKALASVPLAVLTELRDTWLTEESTPIVSKKINLTAEEKAFVNHHPVIRVHNELNWAPFNFVENGVASGFSIDYMNLLAAKAGIHVEYVSGPAWNEFISMIKDRRLDVMLNIVKTKQREKFIHFSKEPYIETPRAIVVRKDDSTIHSLKDLYGKTVAVEEGFFYANYLSENHPKIKVLKVKDTVETLRVVANGDADATLGVIAVEQYLIKRHFFSNLKLVIAPEEKSLRSFDQYIGVRSDWPVLAGILDKAMAAVSDKERVALSQKWIVQEESFRKLPSLTEEEKNFLEQNEILRVAYDIDWPPVEFSDKELGMQGIAADYLERIGRILGISFEPAKPRPWKDMIAAVKNRELDFFSAISPTPQRRRWMGFTDSYLSFSIVIITDKDVGYIGGLSELSGKTISVADGYGSHDLLVANHPELTLMPVNNVKEGLMAVSIGKAFAFVGSLATASQIMSREGLNDLKVSGETPYSFEIAMGAHKDNRILLSIINKALASITTRERNEITSRWTSVIFEHATNYSLIWQIIGIGIVVIFIILYWNGRLQREIAERKRAEEAAEAANRAKSDFLANMSHELRTPLNAILGFAQIMERNAALSSEKEHLAIIQRSGTHLLTLINQVLDFSKIEAGHIDVEEYDFDLFLLLEELEEMLSLKADKKNISLRFHISPEVPRYIRSDEVKLRQVLINLISNGIKFTDEGSVTLRVSLEVDREIISKKSSFKDIPPQKQAICFELQDTGPGIAENERTHLFEAFRQTTAGKTAREGTGLGLAISNKFIQMLGGNMQVSSELGKGTVFNFDIAVKAVGEEQIEEKRSHRRVLSLAPGQNVARMLIVDDNWENRRFLFELLEPFGFELREAGNGKEAIDLLDNWTPQMIWMDMRMPVMDGYEAIKIIRSEPHQADQIKIIAVTASVLDRKKDKLLNIGCNDVIIKPFEENNVVKMIEKHLGLTFLYSAEKTPHENIPPKKERVTVLSEHLQDIPKELIEKLTDSVAALEMDNTLETIDKIRKYNEPLAEELARITEEFRFDILQKLLEQGG